MRILREQKQKKRKKRKKRIFSLEVLFEERKKDSCVQRRIETKNLSLRAKLGALNLFKPVTVFIFKL